jgi:hypothetical protein
MSHSYAILESIFEYQIILYFYGKAKLAQVSLAVRKNRTDRHNEFNAS